MANLSVPSTNSNKHQHEAQKQDHVSENILNSEVGAKDPNWSKSE